MAAGKKGRRIIPSELLEILDLEERQLLAPEIGLTPPKNLNDGDIRKEYCRVFRHYSPTDNCSP